MHASYHIIKRVNGPQAQKRPPPPVVGTEVRAFNATAMLPPNSTVTGSVIGEQAPIKSPLFLALFPRMDEGMIRYSMADVISHRGAPQDA